MAEFASTLDSWPVREVASFACSPGHAMCVSVRLSIVIVSVWPEHGLEVYDMHTGILRNRFSGHGLESGLLTYLIGDMCAHPPDADDAVAGIVAVDEATDADMVVVADTHNNRLSQFNVHTGAWVRHIGDAELAWRRECPKYVACTMHTVVAMSDWRCSVFNWDTGRRLYFVTAPTEDPFRSSLHVIEVTGRNLPVIAATISDPDIVVMNPLNTSFQGNVAVTSYSTNVLKLQTTDGKVASGGMVATDTASSSLSQLFVKLWKNNVYRVLLPLNEHGSLIQVQHVPLPDTLTQILQVKASANGGLYIKTWDRVHVFCEWRLRLYWIWIAATLHTTTEVP